MRQMGFFDNLKSSLAETGQDLSQKAKDTTEIFRLTNLNKTKEKEIEKNIELKNVYKEKRTAHYDIRPYEDLRSDESGRCANVYDISITSAIPLILNHIHTQTDQVED